MKQTLLLINLFYISSTYATTFNISTLTSAPQSLGVNETGKVESTGSIIGQGSDPQVVTLNGSGSTLTNSGIIQNSNSSNTVNSFNTISYQSGDNTKIKNKATGIIEQKYTGNNVGGSVVFTDAPSINGTFTNDGIIRAEGSSSVSGTLSTSSHCIYISQDNASIVNNGTVESYVDNLRNYGIRLLYGNNTTFTNNGDILIDADAYFSSRGIQTDYGNGSIITNNGKISITGQATAVANCVISFETNNHLINNGTMYCDVPCVQNAGFTAAEAHCSITNNGEIETHNDSGFSNGCLILNENCKITNNGIIKASATTPDNAFGIYSNSNNTTVINHGSIYAIDGTAVGLFPGINNTFTTTTRNIIEGKIVFSSDPGNSFTVSDPFDTNSYFQYSGVATATYSGSEAHIITPSSLSIIGASNFLAETSLAYNISKVVGSNIEKTIDTFKPTADKKQSFSTTPFYRFQERNQKGDRYASHENLAGSLTIYNYKASDTTQCSCVFGTYYDFIQINTGLKDNIISRGGVIGIHAHTSNSMAKITLGIDGGFNGRTNKRMVYSNIASGGIDTLYGSFDEWFTTPSVSVALPTEYFSWIIKPQLSLRYILQMRNAYKESLLNDAHLTIHHRNVHNFAISTDVSAQKELNHFSTLEVSSSIESNFLLNSDNVKVSHAGVTKDVELRGNTCTLDITLGTTYYITPEELPYSGFIRCEVRNGLSHSLKSNFGASLSGGYEYTF